MDIRVRTLTASPGAEEAVATLRLQTVAGYLWDLLEQVRLAMVRILVKEHEVIRLNCRNTTGF